jgi:hypothetical protein
VSWLRAHDPEKWKPVFRKDPAPTIKAAGSMVLQGRKLGQGAFSGRRFQVNAGFGLICTLFLNGQS